MNKQFKKETFKKNVKENVKFLYRKKLEEASQEQLFQAVCYTVKDVIIDNWLESQNAFSEQDPKISVAARISAICILLIVFIVMSSFH